MPWIHHTLVTAPFTDFTWQHIRRTVAQRSSRVQHEHDLALALCELLERAAARARAHGAANEDGAVWGLLYGQPPPTQAGPDEDDVFDDGEDLFAEDEEEETAAATGRGFQPLGPADARGVAAPETKGDQTRPSRDSSVTVYDPFEESLRW
ncbi:hypothetical protein ACFC0S_33915 [Streptomyces sp. NPDC056084]|uniref:hypothetical protein n=1 Tax=unclassified Streptomyces TaxID=2593676 RepID=UPI0035DCA11C